MATAAGVAMAYHVFAPSLPRPLPARLPSQGAVHRAAAPIGAARASDPPRTDAVRQSLLGLAHELSIRDPAAAVAWALALEQPERDIALDAILKSTTLEPALLVKIGLALLQIEPATASARGSDIIATLTSRGQFAFAAQFAASAPSELARDWTSEIYSRWARQDSRQATIALQALTEPALRDRALQALIDTWVQDDPATLAAASSMLPPGEMRTYAVRESARTWANRDHVAMAAWVNSLAPGPEHDLALAWLLAPREAP